MVGGASARLVQVLPRFGGASLAAHDPHSPHPRQRALIANPGPTLTQLYNHVEKILDVVNPLQNFESDSTDSYVAVLFNAALTSSLSLTRSNPPFPSISLNS